MLHQPCVVGVVVVVNVVIVVSVSSNVQQSDTHHLDRARVAWRTDDSFRCDHSHHTTGQSLQLAHSCHERNFTWSRKLSHLPGTPTHSLHGNSRV